MPNLPKVKKVKKVENKTPTRICDTCHVEVYDIGKGWEGHWWGCIEQGSDKVVMKIAERLENIASHLNC